MAVLAVFSLLLVRPAAGQQAPTYRAPRFIGTQNPDLNGTWQALNTARWDVEPHAAAPAPFPALLGVIGAVPAGQGVVEGGKIPYQPSAAARKKENFEKRLTRPADLQTNETTGDPEAKCYLPGVPRATYMPFPFRIVQTPKQILIAYEFAGAARTIFMDRKPQAPADSWMGWSIGHWESDTLVVDVTNQIEKTWFDRAGNFHSDALRLVERYSPISPDAIRYEVTIEDPKTFVRPWTITMPLYRRLEANATVLDYPCKEFADEFMYGHLRKEQLVKRWEGETLIVDITRKIPPGDRLHDWYRR
jgi:hypothetical protein